MRFGHAITNPKLAKRLDKQSNFYPDAATSEERLHRARHADSRPIAYASITEHRLVRSLRQAIVKTQLHIAASSNAIMRVIGGWADNLFLFCIAD
jgi:hypothetical protein